MARPLGIERAGHWYHVTSRKNERKDIFRQKKVVSPTPLELAKEATGFSTSKQASLPESAVERPHSKMNGQLRQ